MSFLFINKDLQVNNSKTRKAMNAKISVFVIRVKVIIHSLLSNLRDVNFKFCFQLIKSKTPNIFCFLSGIMEFLFIKHV